MSVIMYGCMWMKLSMAYLSEIVFDSNMLVYVCEIV